MPPKHNIQTYSNIEYSNSECVISIDGQKIKTNIETALFWGMINMIESGIRVEVRDFWYMHYLLEKIPNYSIEIGSNDIRLQWLINCLSASLKSRYHNLENEIESLYGALWDYPEILEKNWEPRNVRVSQLLKHFENKRNEDEKREVWRKYKNKLLNVLGNESIELDSEAQEYIVWKYSQKRSPKKEELESYWVSSELADKIVKKWSFVLIQSLLKTNPIELAEYQWYKLFELYTYQHLKEESNITWSCVWDSKTYINKINTGSTKIYSLRKEWDKDSNTTIEYSCKKQTITQIEWKLYTWKETNILLRLFHGADIKVEWFEGNTIEDYIYRFGNVLYRETESSPCILDRYYQVPKEHRGNIIWWIVKPDECDKWEDIKHYLKLPNIVLDTTYMRQKDKNKITDIHCKEIIDTSKKIEYKNLTHTKGSLLFNNTDYINCPKLKHVYHTLDIWGITAVNLPKLEKARDIILSGVKQAKLWNLLEVENDLIMQNVKNIFLPNLKKVGNDFLSNDANTISCESIEYIWNRLNIALIKNKPNLPKLKYVQLIIIEDMNITKALPKNIRDKVRPNHMRT